MFGIVYNKARNAFRKISMKLARKRYGYREKLPKNIHYFDGGLYDAIYEAAKKWPHNTALEYFNTQITYKELIRRVDRVARSLKALGLKKGDKITICMPNTPEALYMFYAVNKIGAVASMIHPLSSEKEIEHYLRESNSKLMLCIDVAYTKVEPILKNTSVKYLVVTSATKSTEWITSFLYWLTKGRKVHIKKSQQIMLWNHFLLQSNKFPNDTAAEVASTDPAVILYSGGTSGTPKGVILSNLNFNAQALTSKYYAPNLLVPEGSFLTFLPNFHAFGLGICTHIPLYWGMRVILIPQFNAKKLKSYVRKYHFSVLCGVPTIYEYLTKIKFKKNELSCLRAVISGGDAMSLPLKQKVNQYLKDHGSPVGVQVGYGLTEVSGVVAFSPEGITKAADIIGYAMPDCDFYIQNLQTGKESAVNEDGEILISGPTLMLGYLNNPQETAASFVTIKNKRYLKTGDIGFIDQKGLLHYKTRLKRIIITNGYNVYPSHVESVIMKSSNVEKCAVIGIPNATHGETVKAFIVFKPGCDNHSSKAELTRLLKKHLAKYEIPREIRYLDSLPLTKMNKVDFRALAEIN